MWVLGDENKDEKTYKNMFTFLWCVVWDINAVLKKWYSWKSIIF